MKVAVNIWKDQTGSLHYTIPDSDDDTKLKRHPHLYMHLGTKTEEIEPPMREVEKEGILDLCTNMLDGTKYVQSRIIPPDSYDHKLTYKVKEKV